MGRAEASIEVPGLASEAEALWYDPVRWPAWIDGFGHVVELDDGWPAEGAARLDSTPEGRGRVLETVTAYEPRGGQTLDGRGQPPARHPAGRVHARPGQREGHALARLRAQGARTRSPGSSTCCSCAARSSRRCAGRCALRPRAARRMRSWRPSPAARVIAMFVFKAAVVGAGVMGGEIAQVIAAADIPVMLKDVDQRFVDTGLEKAREVTAEPGRQARQQGQAHARSRATPRSSAIARPHHRHDRLRGLRRRRLRDRGGPGEDGDQARGVRRARRGHARPRRSSPPTPPASRSPRSPTPRSGPTRSSASTSSGPRRSCA